MNGGMTSKERVLTVLNGQIPDRVPHFEWEINSPVVTALTNGGTYDDLVELLDIDAVVVGAEYHKESIGDNLILNEWGVTFAKGAVERSLPVDALAPIRSWQDFEKWSAPDPLTPSRFESAKRRIERFKDKRAIILYVRDVWSYPRDLMGYMELFIACLEQPDLVSAVVEKCIDHTLKVVERFVEMGVEVVFTGDDIADNRMTLISPELWEDLFMPHFRKLVEAFHSFGLYYWKHSDGNIMSIMDMLVDAGIDGIDPIDPLGNMDLALIKEKYGDSIAIKGNVDCVDVLVNGPKEAVIQAVKECIRIAGPGGGYVCSSSNTIHTGVKPILYKTMVEAIHTYGTYPLDMEKLNTSAD